ncbi:hypothetical protein [Ferrimonas senticii]|uniref:hypothetical protein n=1 Tax=Ferrimonas senticii TaxID=394566 RepID=UPI000686BED2|nr:hypothetical protein [Ferrimonas senticii]
MAFESQMVLASKQYLTDQINSINDWSIRNLVTDIYRQPTPMVLEQLDNDNRTAVWKELLAKNYSNSDLDHFLPNQPVKQADYHAFYSAPGSGYGSHHSYPGGLATHLAANVHITNGIVNTYQETYNYKVDRDIAVAAQLLHDLHKPLVFPWLKDHSCRKENTLADTGEHHVLSIAELIARNMPAELVVATACAHQAPMTLAHQQQIAKWLDAAAIINGIDPVRYGLLTKQQGQLRLNEIAQQEGFICHIGDHDYVLSVPAVQQTLPVLRKIAHEQYAIADDDHSAFNALRNRIYSLYSAMQIHAEFSNHGEDRIKAMMLAAVQP